MTKIPRHLSQTSVLILSDTLGFMLVVVMAMFMAVSARWVLLGVVRYPSPDEVPQILTVFSSAFIVLIWRSISLGHYSQFRPFWLELQEVIKTVMIIAALDVFLLFIIGVQFSRLWFGFFLLSLILVIPYGRELSKRVMIHANIWYRPTYIVGTGSSAISTLSALESDSSLGHRVVGFVDLSGRLSDDFKISGLPVIDYLPDGDKDSHGDEVKLVFAFDTFQELALYESEMSKYIASHSSVTVIPPPVGLPLYGASVTGIFRYDTALLKMQNRLLSHRSQLIKKSVDIIIGLSCLLLFSPLFLLIALLIKRDRGPVFYKHRRVGKRNKEFDCYKFRTMLVDSDTALERYLSENPVERDEWKARRKLRTDPRVTRIGAYLRQTSMDELPQLWNVIRGEMSLVGPRPVVREELDRYENYAPYYLTMTPGMSGLWQVSGRTDTSYAERIRLDVWYSRNWSLWTDVVILIKTTKTLVSRHGAY